MQPKGCLGSALLLLSPYLLFIFPLVDVLKSSLSGCQANVSSTAASGSSVAPAVVTRQQIQQQSSDWHRSLLDILFEDLIKHAPEFPLQVRWIYSELQVGGCSLGDVVSTF